MALFPKERDLNRPLEQVELSVDASFFRVKAADFQVRLDHFLGAHLTWRSRTSLQALVREGFVLLDASSPEHPEGTGERVVERRPGRRVRHGSRVVVVIPEDLRLPVPAGPLPGVDVVYEDGGMLVVDKPPHLAVHPSGRHSGDTLIQRIHARYEDEIAERREAPRLAHRLDRETSGVVVIGKGPAAHRVLRQQFEAGEVEKAYLAIVEGVPEADAGSIRLPIGAARASRIRLKMAVQADGLASRTDYRVVERLARHALVECRLYTGRQHQIRVHLAALGHPIVGDKLYGPDDEHFIRAAEGRLGPADLLQLGHDRQALHHHRVGLLSPDTGRRVVIESPLAYDLRALLERLRLE